MFRNILVPLDGSTLSEASLVAAAILADRFESSVTLLHVIERDAPSEVHHERHLTTADEARAYLKRVAARAFPPRTKTAIHVHEAAVSDVALSIVEHATVELRSDLIVTCTHGTDGVRDLLFGSIAQQIVAQGRLPLLLIKPTLPGFDLKKILVPLDPDSMHDSSLEPAAAIASALQATLELLSVIPTIGSLAGEEAATSSLMPMTAQAVLELRQEQALEHLTHHADALEKRGLVVLANVGRGDAATQILRSAEQGRADLIVLSTHRKAGLEAFWSKSVAPRVAQITRKPLLLIPLE